MRQPGLGNAVNWRKEFGGGRVGETYLPSSHVTQNYKNGAVCLLNSLTGPVTRLDPLSELSATVWTNLRLIKAVCGLNSRPMYNFLLFS